MPWPNLVGVNYIFQNMKISKGPMNQKIVLVILACMDHTLHAGNAIYFCFIYRKDAIIIL